jgi:hypothetical protein
MFEDILKNKEIKTLIPSTEERLKLMINFFKSDIWEDFLKNNPTVEDMVKDLKDIIIYLETGKKPK